MMKRMFLLGLCSALLGVGCGDDGTAEPDAGPPDGTDAGPPGFDAGPRQDAGRPMDAGPAEGDGNDSFAEAETITPEADATGAIQEPDDKDYFTFEVPAEAEGGTFVVMTTDANPDDDTDMVDTVLTLYDSSMTQIAENDDAYPRVNTDSEIITFLLPGTYYIEVQEWSTWTGEPGEGDPSFTYDLSFGFLNLEAPFITLEDEAGDDAASATTLATDAGDDGMVPVGWGVGTFEDDTDVDVFQVEITEDGRNFQISVMPSGTDGYGSTSSPANVWVTMDGDDDTIIARLDGSDGEFFEVDPSLGAGTYNIWVANSGDASGAGAFYLFKSYQFEDNPAEVEPNNMRAGAQALDQMRDDEGFNRAFVLANLADDDDWFSFEVADGEVFVVACGSRSGGSGVRGLTAEVTSDDGTQLAEETEDAADGLFIDETDPGAAGTYFLHLSKTGQDPMVTGNWVRCGVRVGEPTP